jgi:hypothetical protein
VGRPDAYDSEIDDELAGLRPTLAGRGTRDAYVVFNKMALVGCAPPAA